MGRALSGDPSTRNVSDLKLGGAAPLGGSGMLDNQFLAMSQILQDQIASTDKQATK